MISCRYISADSSEIGDREFDAIGQRATFSEQGYREAVLGGAAFLPDNEFSKLGFTQAELDSFGPVGTRADPPPVFVEKLLKGQEAFREILSNMRGAAMPVVLADASSSSELAGV
jgi:hypothetical protein